MKPEKKHLLPKSIDRNCRCRLQLFRWTLNARRVKTSDYDFSVSDITRVRRDRDSLVVFSLIYVDSWCDR